MSAPAGASPKAAKVSKPKTAKKAASHPTYSAMIRRSISELKDKSGSSKAAILKYMLAHYKLGENVTKINAQLRLALKRGVVKGDLKQVKGSGASGSFRLGEKKAAAPAAKKSVTKKPAGAKKPKSPKKVAAAKKPKAEKKAKSPKKAKAPKAKTAKKPTAKTSKPKATKPKASKPKAVKKVKA
uniref:H15 domain-containing protein n=1 Tax=Haemonchus contortus TaxID=6289 RepID=A0A7I5E7M5_HAECO|nr:Histone H1 H5 domain containing protein [Haemonchus contortus]